MNTLTIPKSIINDDDLIVIPRREYELLLKRKGLTEDDLLRWRSEARNLKRRGKLPLLKSLRDLR